MHLHSQDNCKPPCMGSWQQSGWHKLAQWSLRHQHICQLGHSRARGPSELLHCSSRCLQPSARVGQAATNLMTGQLCSEGSFHHLSWLSCSQYGRPHPAQQQAGRLHKSVAASAAQAVQTRPAADTSSSRIRDGSRAAAQLTQKPAPAPPKLNDSQRAAAHSDISKPLLIIAGAGTGKTTTLIGRLYHMLKEKGVKPQNILAVTFTVKAANELRERLAKLGVHNVRALDVRTFHGMAFRILDKNFHLAGFSQPPVVWSSDVDRKAVVREAMRRAELEKARQQAVRWLHLEPGSSWADIAAQAQQMHPALYTRAEEKAFAVVEASSKKRSTKKQPATEAKSLDRVRSLELQMELHAQLKGRYLRRSQDAGEKLGQPPSKEKLQEMFAWFRGVKSMSHTPEMYEGHFQGLVFKIYQDILHSCSAVDFDDILVLAHNIVVSNPGLLQQLQSTYHYLLVDEYQDSNPVQINFVKALIPPGGRVTAVGDDAQSIYRFRGTDSSAFRQYIDAYQHPGLQSSLTVNYRSTSAILQASEAALQGTQSEIVPKRLIVHDDAPSQPVTIWSVEDENAEATEVAGEIQRLHNHEGLLYKDIAVLFRAIRGNRSGALQKELDKRGIPFTLVKEYPFLEREFVADVMGLLTLALQPNNDQAFLRMMKRPPRGLGPAVQQQVEHQRDAMMLSQPDKATSLHAAAQELVTDASRLGNAATLKLRAYLNVIAEMREKSERLTPSEMVMAAIGSPGYLAHLQKRKVTQTAGAAGIWLPPNDDDSKAEEAAPAPSVLTNLLAKDAGVDAADVGNDDHLLRLMIMARNFEDDYNAEESVEDPPADDASAIMDIVELSDKLDQSAAFQRAGDRQLGEKSKLEGAERDAILCGQQSLREFISSVALDEAVGEETKGVIIGTIHSAKGLEWDTVFLMRCNHGSLPMESRDSSMTAVKPVHSSKVLHTVPPPEQDHVRRARDMEQEHRLVYVAMTRARKRLYLASLRTAFRNGKKEFAPPAKFLGQILQLGASVCKGRRL